jgi:hypothetical protein
MTIVIENLSDVEMNETGYASAYRGSACPNPIVMNNPV